LQLIAGLNAVGEDLLQLAALCKCLPCTNHGDSGTNAGEDGGGGQWGCGRRTGSSGGTWVAQHDGNGISSGGMNGASGLLPDAASGGAATGPIPAPAASTALLPWPAELAPWASYWGWHPSQWQVEGCPTGSHMLDALYAGMLATVRQWIPHMCLLILAQFQ
jgi:hypothetical protein